MLQTFYMSSVAKLLSPVSLMVLVQNKEREDAFYYMTECDGLPPAGLVWISVDSFGLLIKLPL